MSVLKGEGRVPILFGTTSVPVGTLSHTGYLARPDLSGEWPTMILIPSVWGVTSSIKDICRRLARWGFAVIAPDLYRGRLPDRDLSRQEARKASTRIPDARAMADLSDFAEFIANPAGHWSNAEDGFGLLGMGAGGRLAAIAGARLRGARALALVHAPIRSRVGDSLSRPPDIIDVANELTLPMLGLYGTTDDEIPQDDVLAARERAPHAEWVLYESAGADFMDDYRESYDGVAAADAIERLVDFFEKHLPAAPAI